MNKKAPGIFTKLCTVLFAVVIVIGLVWFYLYGAGSQIASLEGSGETSSGFTDTEQETTVQRSTGPNVYTKLSSGEAVRIAIIGDTFGASEGASEGKEWDTQLSELLQNAYSSEVTIDNLSVSVTTAYQGYCTVMQKEWTEYDLVIVCFGSMDQNGELEDFQRDYEAIVRNLRNKNSNLVIMPMISTYVSNSEFSETIRSVAAQYGLSCLNMKNAFVDSGMDEAALTTNDIYPNDKGYEIYAQSIAGTIQQNIQDKVGVPEGSVKILYQGVRKMRKFQQLAPSDLNAVSSTEYTYTGAAKLLGIAYMPTSTGSDTITVAVNGETVSTIDCVTSYDTDEVHYAVGAVGVEDGDTVTISVNGYGGAEFEGIVISG